MINDSVFKDHLGGGIIASLEEESEFKAFNNKIANCKTAGIYIQGEESKPLIEWNEIINCKGTGIKTYQDVNAEITENILRDNNNSIEILNNKSHILNNEIDKSHGHGINIEWDNKDKKCNPKIKGNLISSSKLNGIQISGKGTHVIINNNTIKNNRKCGIRLTDHSKADINGRNFIHTNYNQGILIEEGSSAKILENTISKNLKANIAFGGKGSQHTRIDKNEISESVAEGIFLVDGENHTYINENIIRDNLDGISLFNSKGQITQNLIEGNQRWGIQWSGTTTADITSNQIKNNILIGLLIKEPSLPKIQSNVMKDNHYQISVDKHVAKKFQAYKTLNTIKGACDVPKSTWNIF